MRSGLPTGTVTFVFTDVEGSTSLLSDLGAETYADVLADHRAVIREACTGNGGVEVDTQGDALFFAFPTAPGALAAALAFTERLAANGPIRVRVGIHTGTPLVGDEGYVGRDVHRAARIAAAGHGGQVLVSESTAVLLDTELTDLGEHRFKDLGAPERVFQLGAGEFPTLKSLYRTNLPVSATPFLGRERELREVLDLLVREDSRLVTLAGPGGTGKTRLMVQAAAEAAERFPHGVFWIPLAPLGDESDVPATIAQALGVVERPGVALEDSIVASFARERALIVADNCEHLVAGVAGIVRRIVDGCPTVVVVASSRERIGLRAERIYEVPPMAPSDALGLFVERASAVDSGFQIDAHVAAICEAVDELPLAIELAAARVRSLSTAAIHERLTERLGLLISANRDVEERQRTLEATIAWSYDLLDDDERQALRNLSVFAGGCTLSAAQVVAGADLDLVESLLDKSLLRHRVDETGDDRYWMLETVREYALRELHRTGEAPKVGARHATFFLVLAEKGAAEFDRGEQGTWAQRLDIERDNLRAALEHFTDSGQSSLELRFVALMWKVWFDQGRWQESRRAIERALASSSGTTQDRVTVMLGAAWSAWRQGDARTGTRFAEESLELSRALDDPPLIARSLRILGACVEGDDPDRASALTEESAALSESIGDVVGLTAALNNLALMALAPGNDRRAADMFARALSIARQSGNRRGCSVYLMNLADAERRLGEFELARAHLAEGFATARELGIREVVVEVLYGLAALASDTGDYGWAAALIGAAQREGDFGHVLEDRDREVYERTISSVRQGLGAQGMDSAIAAGRGLTLDAVVTYLEKGHLTRTEFTGLSGSLTP